MKSYTPSFSSPPVPNSLSFSSLSLSLLLSLPSSLLIDSAAHTPLCAGGESRHPPCARPPMPCLPSTGLLALYSCPPCLTPTLALSFSPPQSLPPPPLSHRNRHRQTRQSTGIGEFLDLKLMADWCTKSGLQLIQILPINDSGEVRAQAGSGGCGWVCGELRVGSGWQWLVGC